MARVIAAAPYAEPGSAFTTVMLFDTYHRTLRLLPFVRSVLGSGCRRDRCYDLLDGFRVSCAPPRRQRVTAYHLRRGDLCRQATIDYHTLRRADVRLQM